MERERSGEWTKLPFKFRSMLNLRNAVQNAKSILPDMKNKVLIGIWKSNYKLTRFCYRLHY